MFGRYPGTPRHAAPFLHSLLSSGATTPLPSPALSLSEAPRPSGRTLQLVIPPDQSLVARGQVPEALLPPGLSLSPVRLSMHCSCLLRPHPLSTVDALSLTPVANR